MLKKFKTLSWLLLSVFANSCLAGNIIHLEHSARQIGLAGAFIAQVNDGTSMLSNPAGFSPSHDSYERVTEFSVNSAWMDNFEAKLVDEDLIPLSFLWSTQSKRSAYGVGAFDSISMGINYYDPKTETRKADYITGYDFIFNGAITFNDHLKVGISPRITSAGPSNTDIKDAESEAHLAIKIGTLIKLFDDAFNFGLSTSIINMNIGATYQPETKLRVYERLKGHVLAERKISVLPETAHLGSNLAMGWLSENNSIVLHINTDIEKQTYTQLSDLLVETPSSQDINFTHVSVGAELQYKRGNSKITYILRGGKNERVCEAFSDLDESSTAIGLGFSSHAFTFDLAHQVTTSIRRNNTKNSNTNNTAISLSWTF